jgi:uroporphyrinogen decarboxylase
MNTVLERREPDRVPTFEWKVSQPLIDAFAPGGDVFDFIEAAGHDAVCCAPSYEKLEIIDEDTFVDEFHITRHLTGADRYPVSVGHPITDLASFKRYEPPSLDAEGRFTRIEDTVRRYGEELAVVVNLHDIFSYPRDLLGLDNFLVAFITEPQLVREIVGFSVEYNLELAKLVKKRGVEIIGIGDDLADNNLLVESGIDCLDPIDPLGSMDIGIIRERYGDRIARKGNIDCVHGLVDETPEELVAEVLDCIRRGSPGGGHIISSSNSLHAGIDPALYRVMLDTVREHGNYPL